MFSLMANIRGSREYFAKLAMDVKWMGKQLGPPTLFVTCSTAEWYAEPLINYLKTINSSIASTEKMTPSELCAMDPLNVSIHFHKQWKAIFTKLINSKDKPFFGQVEDYFWRIEYQARGAPHVHISSQRCTACASDSLDQRCPSSWSQHRRRDPSLHLEHHHMFHARP